MYDWKSGGFGLYLHWPFCQSKCPYCDFNSHVVAKIDQRQWLSCYLLEIERYGQETSGRTLETIYFGGGTPSLMDPEIVASIIDKVRATWPTVNNFEVTLEANPTSVEAAKFRAYRDAGVNRVSLGVQALDDDALKQLGRLHTKREALVALEVARQTFDRVSFDLIYARQNQSLQEWRTELMDALSVAGDHLSLYQLTIEDGTAFADRFARGGLLGLPDEDRSAEMYEVTQDICDNAGLPAYEVSNHARPGFESRHNTIYWRGGDYIGVGPGAHGRITTENGRVATETRLSPSAWLNDVKAGLGGESVRTVLKPKDLALEYLLMSLRTTEGLDLRRYNDLSVDQLDSEKMSELESLGLLARSETHLKSTRSGRLVLNAILRELAPN